jgi:hypothetical protein
MQTTRLSFTPADANLTGFASNVTGATWTLTATSSTDALAHRISIKNDSVTSHSGKTALLTGTDVDGYVLTETITLPGASATVESSNYFKTLTSVVPSATIGADTMDIGWVDEFISQTIPTKRTRSSRSQAALALRVIVTGTINYTVQQTLDDVQTLTDRAFDWASHDSGSVVAATVSANANYLVIPEASRLKVNSYSSGATIQYIID